MGHSQTEEVHRTSSKMRSPLQWGDKKYYTYYRKVCLNSQYFLSRKTLQTPFQTRERQEKLCCFTCLSLCVSSAAMVFLHISQIFSYSGQLLFSLSIQFSLELTGGWGVNDSVCSSWKGHSRTHLASLWRLTKLYPHVT